MLGLEPGEMNFAAMAPEETWGLGGQMSKAKNVCLASPLLLPARREAFHTEIPYRFKHRISRLGILSEQPEHAFIYQGDDAIEDVKIESSDRRTHGLGGIQCKASGENRETREEDLFLGREKVMTPSDGIAQRLLPGWEIPGAAGEE